MKEDETPTSKSAALHTRLSNILSAATDNASDALDTVLRRKTASAKPNTLADRVAATLSKIAAAKEQPA